MLPAASDSIAIPPSLAAGKSTLAPGVSRFAAWTPPHRAGIGRAASRSAPEPLEDLSILDHDSDSDSDDIYQSRSPASAASFSRTPPVRKLPTQLGTRNFNQDSESDSADDSSDDEDHSSDPDTIASSASASASDVVPARPSRAALKSKTTAEPKKKTPQPFARLADEYSSVLATLRSADSSHLEKLVRRASRGLSGGFLPELLDEGEGGAYLVRDEDGDCLGIFKPADEEPFAPGNPKLARRQSADSNNAKLKAGVRPGEAAVREFAAYLLDRDRAAGVPPTCMVELFHAQFAGGRVKRGSLQQFIPHDHQAWDIGPAQYSVAEVHRIGLLDVRLFNTDRHGGNILVKRLGARQYRLSPIDHGFVLPESVDGAELWFEWMTWPQSRQPFDADTLRYVLERVSVEEDARLLRQLGLREPCVATLIRSTALLKRAAARGMTLHQIGAMLCRREPERPSLLEQVVKQAMPQDVHSRYYVAGLQQAADALLDRPAKNTRDRSKPSPAPPSPRTSHAGGSRLLKSSASSLALLSSPSQAPAPSASAVPAVVVGEVAAGGSAPLTIGSSRSRPLASQSIDSVAASNLAIKRTASSYDFMLPLPHPHPSATTGGFSPAYALSDDLSMRRNVSTEALLTAVSQ